MNNTESANTATGYQALLNSVTGQQNTAVGYQALLNNNSGANTATGYQALFATTTGSANTANGIFALSENTTGSGNTASGAGALTGNTIGSNNTAAGTDALSENTTGEQNVANGAQALFSNTEGVENTAIGFGALSNNTTGSFNIAVGDNAGASLTTGDLNIDVGNAGVPDELATIRIGFLRTRTFIAGIVGAPVTGTEVVVTASGQLGVAASSARFKDAIKPMSSASEAILALRPVTFQYKKEIDPEGVAQFGLVAEEVAKTNPALVTRDADGKPYTVRYDAVNAMLLNEFIKEHRKVEQQDRKIHEQEATISQLKKGMETVVTRLKEQDSKIQKVSEHVQTSNSSARVVVSNR